MSRPDPRYEWMSLDEFEEMLPDKPRDEKWELIGGRVVRMMVGARWEHHEVASNLHVALKNHVRDRGMPCRVFQESFWLKDRTQDLAVFPDVILRCGAMKPGQTSVDDPLVLIEVLSRGTADRDVLEKKPAYQRIDSVAHVVFVDLDRRSVEVTTRVEGGWSCRVHTDAEDVATLDAIGFSIALTDVFRDLPAVTGPVRRPTESG